MQRGRIDGMLLILSRTKRRVEVGRRSVISIARESVGKIFFRIWGTKRVFVRMREIKRAHMAPLSAACVKVT